MIKTKHWINRNRHIVLKNSHDNRSIIYIIPWWIHERNAKMLIHSIPIFQPSKPEQMGQKKYTYCKIHLYNKLTQMAYCWRSWIHIWWFRAHGSSPGSSTMILTIYLMLALGEANMIYRQYCGCWFQNRCIFCWKRTKLMNYKYNISKIFIFQINSKWTGICITYKYGFLPLSHTDLCWSQSLNQGKARSRRVWYRTWEFSKGNH